MVDLMLETGSKNWILELETKLVIPPYIATTI